MAFPNRLGVTETLFNSMATAHAVGQGAVITAGDLLLMIFVASADGSDGATTITDPSGYTELRDRQYSLGDVRQHTWIGAKAAIGNEDGLTVNVQTSVGLAAVAQVFRYEVGTWSGNIADIFVTAHAEAESINPNPPNCNPAAGAKDYEWIAVCTFEDSDFVATVAPANFANLNTAISDSTEDSTLSTATRQLNAASLDPGTFTADEEKWQAFTIAIPPAAGGSPATVTPAAIAVAVTVPTPTVLAASTVTPAAVAVPATLPTPSPLAASVVTPLSIAAIITLPTPVAGVTAVVEPAAIAVPIELPTPSIIAASIVEPAQIDVAVTLPTATAGVQAIVNPDQIDVAIELPTPSPTAPATVTPGAIAVPATVPTPTPMVEATAAPAVIALVTTLPSPTIVQSASVTPAVIMVNVAVPTPNIFAGALEILARVFGQFHRLGTSRLHIARLKRGGRVGFSVTDEGWERVSDVFLFDDNQLGRATHDLAMEAVAAAWAAHASSDEATLTAAIHAALDAFGFRRPDGSRLV